MTPKEERAFLLLRLHFEHGPGIAEVARRYIDGEIQDRQVVRFLPDDTRTMFTTAAWERDPRT